VNTRSNDLLAGHRLPGWVRTGLGGPQRLPRSRLVWWPVTEVRAGVIAESSGREILTRTRHSPRGSAGSQELGFPGPDKAEVWHNNEH
jgi:hypothetical protein